MGSETLPDDVAAMNQAETDVRTLLQNETTLADQIDLTPIAGQILVDVSEADGDSYELAREIREILMTEFFSVRFDATNDARVRVDIL